MVGPHPVRVGGHSSSILILKTGAPQDCVLSIKFADDTVVVGLITDNIKNAFPEGSRGLDPLVSEQPTSERQQGVDSGLWEEAGRELRPPLNINGSSVGSVDSFKYLGVHITEGLTWAQHTHSMVRKESQRLFYLRCLRQLRVSPQIFLLLHHREPPDSEHHCLEHKQNRRPCKEWCVWLKGALTLPKGYLHQVLQEYGQENH